jgi:uncharacterized protein (DUF427 family)
VNAVVKASWNGTVLAESDETIIVEGNHYFPPSSIHEEYLVENDGRELPAIMMSR